MKLKLIPIREARLTREQIALGKDEQERKEEAERKKREEKRKQNNNNSDDEIHWSWLFVALIIAIMLIIGVNSYQNHQAKLDAEQHRQDSIAKSVSDSIERRMLDLGLGRDGVYKIGDYYNRDGLEGVVFEIKDGGIHGKILSLDVTEVAFTTIEDYNFGDNGNLIFFGCELDDNDGISNTRIMKQNIDKFPATKWCINKGKAWYMPSVDEVVSWKEHIKVINETLLKYTDIKIDYGIHSDIYWSSSGVPIVMEPEVAVYCSLDAINYVRAVAIF